MPSPVRAFSLRVRGGRRRACSGAEDSRLCAALSVRPQGRMTSSSVFWRVEGKKSVEPYTGPSERLPCGVHVPCVITPPTIIALMAFLPHLKDTPGSLRRSCISQPEGVCRGRGQVIRASENGGNEIFVRERAPRFPSFVFSESSRRSGVSAFCLFLPLVDSLPAASQVPLESGSTYPKQTTTN